MIGLGASMHIRKLRLRITKPSIRHGGENENPIPLLGAILLILAVSLFGCSGSPTAETRSNVAETLPADSASLETLPTSSPTGTDTPEPTLTASPSPTLEPTDTAEPSQTSTSTTTPTRTSTITKTPTQTSTQTSTPTATNLPSQTPLPTYTLTPTTMPVLTTGKITIDKIYYDGTGDKEPDEYVVITNRDSSPIQLQGWTLYDIADHVYYFPSYVIQPDESCRIYTNEDHPEFCGFNYRETASAIWNNSGDTATLEDAAGTIIDTYQY